MRVLHCSTARIWRGGEQQVAYLLKGLREQGVRQKVLCVPGAPIGYYCEKEDFEFTTLAGRRAVRPGNIRRFQQVLQEYRPDVLHSHDGHAHTLACLNASLYRDRIPVIASRRVDFPIGDSLLSRWKYHHPAVRRFICVSDAIRNILAADIGESPKLVTVHSGVDLQRFALGADGRLRREFEIPDECAIVGNVSALAGHKDFATFLNVAQILLEKRSNLRFVIVGDGKERENIEKMIIEKDLQKYVILTGFRTDVDRLLTEFQLFLMTSSTEGLGTTILDALAAGVPVVATQAGGIPEIIEPGKSGLLAPVRDAQVLSVRVLQILDDSRQKEKLVAGGLERVKQFSAEAMAAKTLKVYQSVLREESL